MNCFWYFINICCIIYMCITVESILCEARGAKILSTKDALQMSYLTGGQFLFNMQISWCQDQN